MRAQKPLAVFNRYGATCIRPFLRGFIAETGLDAGNAAEQWVAHAYMLDDTTRRRIEANGYRSGLREGRRFRNMYPVDEEEER